MNHLWLRGLLLTSIALLLASCTPMVDTRGHTLEEADFKQIVIGQSKTDDVQAILGTPTTRSTFGGETWYYISEKKETVGMFAPEVTDQSVTAVLFDEAHTVTDIQRRGKAYWQNVQFVTKTTPTEGHELGVMEQLLGNFGRFSAPGRQISSRDMGR